jgi:hypothetical protein
LNRNLLLDFKSGIECTRILPVRHIVKRFSMFRPPLLSAGFRRYALARFWWIAEEIIPPVLRLSLSENRNDIYAQAPAVAYIGDLLGSVCFSWARFSRPDFHKTAGVNPITEHPDHSYR